jgi:Zn-dependent protease with chaperone function
MNHHVLPPLAVALFAGFLAPALLVRASWPHQAPRLAAGAWGSLAATFVGSVSLTLAQLLLPARSSHRLMSLAEAALPWSSSPLRLPSPEVFLHPGPREAGAAFAAAAVPLLVLALLVRALHRTRRVRTRHAELLRLVGSPDPRLRATVLRHETPVVYCLPGRRPQVVVSTGALATLTEAQLTAALAHERAHVSGRHHVPVAAAEAFSVLFRALPLARRSRRELPLLLEMAADDRALRHSSREALATALYAMAGGRAPQAAFAAGGPSAAVRMRRILSPHQVGCPALRALFAASAAAGALAPLIMACCSIPG